MSGSSFKVYVDIFDQDNTTDNVEPNPVSLQSLEPNDNGWVVVRETDPALASIMNDQSAADSPAECKMRRKRAADATELCGYLNKCKVGSRGGRVFKRRWFVHADQSCKLLYYRTPEDKHPLGEIDVARATFSFDVQPDVSANVFRIT